MKRYSLHYFASGLAATLLAAGCGRDPVTSAMKAIENGNLKKAETLLTQALEQNPSDPSALMNLAIVRLKTGQPDDALTGFAQVADLAKEDPRPLEFIAAILSDNNRWREAMEILTEAARRDPNSPSVQTAIAMAELNTVGAPTARLRLVQVLNRDPNYAPALFNLAVIDRDWMKNSASGRKYFQRYLALAKNDTHAPIARAALAEKIHTAPPPVIPPVVVTPVKPTPHSSRAGTTKPMAERTAPTQPEAKAAPVPRNPAAAAQAFNQGIRFYEAHEIEKAIQSYNQAIQYDPTDARAHYNLGFLLRDKGDLPHAREAFEHAVERAPGMTDARYMLALVMKDQGDESGEAALLKTIVEKSPQHADAHLALGLLYKKDKSKRDLARKELSLYLELQPNGASAREVREWLKYQR